jgi:hypothetical protein
LVIEVISGPNSSPEPLILVLVSYEKTNWEIRLKSEDMFLYQVYLISYKQSATVKGFNHLDEKVTFEIPNQGLTWMGVRGYGKDSGGGRTAAMLLNIQHEIGEIDSFSGTYRSAHWTLFL